MKKTSFFMEEAGEEVMLYLKKRECDMKVGAMLQKEEHCWVSFTKNMIYISRDHSRIVWMFNGGIPPGCKQPKLRFYSSKPAVKFGSTLITFKGDKAVDNYRRAKELIGEWQ